MDDLVLRLQSQAREIAAQGVAGWGNTMTDAADHIEQLKRENAELRRDAERYRFWREAGFAFYADERRWVVTDRGGRIIARGYADNIDAAIDAAMKEAGK